MCLHCRRSVVRFPNRLFSPSGSASATGKSLFHKRKKSRRPRPRPRRPRERRKRLSEAVEIPVARSAGLLSVPTEFVCVLLEETIPRSAFAEKNSLRRPADSLSSSLALRVRPKYGSVDVQKPFVVVFILIQCERSKKRCFFFKTSCFFYSLA